MIRGAARIALSLLTAAGAACGGGPAEPIRFPPVVVMADHSLPGVVVRGAAPGWWKLSTRPARYGDPLPVGITMYCLRGTTRRGRYVRNGIVAADPRFFPLAQYVEIYVGRTYLGRFLVDDTGKRIRGARIDVWTASCREAQRFGLQRGTAVRVRIEPPVQQAGSAGHRAAPASGRGR